MNKTLSELVCRVTIKIQEIRAENAQIRKYDRKIGFGICGRKSEISFHDPAGFLLRRGKDL
jgi:hypothetical protein